MGTEGIKPFLLLAGGCGRAGSNEAGMPCNPMLLLLSLFSYDFCLSLIFMPILITSHLPPCPLIFISVAGFTPFWCRWLSSNCNNFPAWSGTCSILGAFKFFIPVPNPSSSVCPPGEGGQTGDRQCPPAKVALPNPTQVKRLPWRGLCYFLLGLNRHKTVIGAYFQPLHNNLCPWWRRTFLEIQITPVCMPGSCGCQAALGVGLLSSPEGCFQDGFSDALGSQDWMFLFALRAAMKLICFKLPFC